MIRINLLPIRAARKLEAARREFILAMGVGVIVFIVCASAWGALKVRHDQFQTENRALQTQIDQLAADVARVDEMEKFKAELQRKLAVIDSLRAQKIGPVHMMDDLSNATPERLFVTDMQEKSGQVSITGVSVTNEVISDFLRKLDASAYFDNVYLQDIEALEAKGDITVTLKEFKLTAQLVTPKPASQIAAPTAPPAPGEAPKGAGAAPAAPAAPAPEGGA